MDETTARSEAEARRQRILEESNKRLEQVGASRDENDETTTAEGPTGAQKMQAMRRRRFQQKKKAAAAAAAAKEETKNDKEAAKEKDETKKQEKEQKEEETKKIEIKTEEDKAEEKMEEDTNKDEQTTTTTTTTTRKYEGVARMRRKKLKEKQQQKAMEDDDDKEKEDEMLLQPPSTSTRAPMIYIMVQALAIGVLFSFGVMMGLGQQQQQQEQIMTTTLVKTKLSPLENGVGLFKVSSTTRMSPLVDKELLQPKNVPVVSEEEEEFEMPPPESKILQEQQVTMKEEAKEVKITQEEEEETDKEANEQETGDSPDKTDPPEASNEKEKDTAENTIDAPEMTKKQPYRQHMEEEPNNNNIDPLFQVDLDQYTQGPGLFMAAGRVAVRAHRWNLYVFYELPKLAIASLTRLIQNLVTTPPILCLVGLIVRQLASTLGGGGTYSGEESSKGKNVLTLAKEAGMNFVQGMFPNAVAFYRVFMHLRADIYIMLCGFFCGLAWIHTTENTGISDEL